MNNGRDARVSAMANALARLGHTEEAYRQALLSRGDRRLARLLVTADRVGSWKEAVREEGLDTDLFVNRDIPLDELLPWDFIDGGDAGRLEREYRRAFRGE